MDLRRVATLVREALRAGMRAAPAAVQIAPRPRPLIEVVHVVLAENGQAMRVPEIHEAVERLLDSPVKRRSLKGALAAGIRGKQVRLERVGYGAYRALAARG
jgi:hypothetical protein